METKANHTSREASSNLPVTGAMEAQATVSFQESLDPPRWASDGVPIIDLFGIAFELEVTFAGRAYKGSRRWGDAVVSDVREAMQADGLDLSCCATCEHYLRTDLISEWSNGTTGYCTLRGGIERQDFTHMLWWCGHIAVR